jgi:dTDP-4-amino-4,6-dideoxygalactose transaminase
MRTRARAPAIYPFYCDDMAKHNKKTPAIEGGRPVRQTLLPFFRAPISEHDVEAAAEALRSGWLTIGPRTEQFEAALARYLGVEHVVAVSSCSEAMFLALKALGVGPGDEVITSCLTFASTVHAIIHTGATPVLADVEGQTLGPDPTRILEKVNDRTRAIMPVHFGGQACRIEEIGDIAGRRNLAVLEDAAHGFGAEVGGRRLGDFGDATAFSFYATKNLTTAEGGAISTSDGELARRLRLLSYHGMSRDSWERHTDRGSWYYEVEIAGYKSNLNDVLASLGLSQLERIDELIERRRLLASRLTERLSPSPYFELPVERPGNRHTWHLYVIQLNLDKVSIDRDAFIRALTEENIGSSVHFIPIYRHPFFSPYGGDPNDFPACESYFSRCISLPLYPDMEERDVDDVVEALNKIAAYYSGGS